jgi:hypothetical protein
MQHRKGRDGQKASRELSSAAGDINRQEAYQIIDDAKRGTVFFRLVISPDPGKEDTERDLHLAEITSQTMMRLEERVGKAVPYIAATHDDHSPNRHQHILALVQGRLNAQDFQALRQTATEAALAQRKERD